MRTPLAVALCLALAAPACVRDGASSDARLSVVTGAYPLTYVARAVGGVNVTVADLTPPGAEAHDLELTPAQSGDVERADLVLLIPGFQPALDDAAPAAAAVDVTRGWTEPLRAHDPHVWLDPLLLKHVASRVADVLSERDQAHADAYARNAARVGTELDTLHAQLTKALTGCARKEVVTSHAAFGYLAARYGLRNIGIAGLDDEAEPSPRRIAEVVAFVRSNHVTTVYAETAESKPAWTVARETGATVVVLDTIETFRGQPYPAVMRRNAAALHTGLGCRG